MATATLTTISTVCPNCGTTCSLRESEAQIAELQAQVRLLTEKASTAADRLADSEDEVRRLKSQTDKGGPPPTPPPAAVEPSAPQQTTYFQSRFGASLFGSRKAIPAQTPGSTGDTPAGTPAAATDVLSARRESDLQAALVKEQEARRTAEGKVSQMNQEVEDLSVQLFQQANEMVASERKARAKLEERVELLEKRDVEKRKRLERLENALKRIERVRELLAPPPG